MLTIAGGIVLGFFAIMIILAILSDEDTARGCGVFVLWVIGIAVALGLLWLAVAIWGDVVFTYLGALVLMGIASPILGRIYDGIARLTHRPKERSQQEDEPPPE